MRYARSRRTKKLIVIAVVAIILHVSIADRIINKDNAEFVSLISPANDVSNFHQKVFKVIKVVDGDTIDFDNPNDSLEPQRLRLIGIDTPETKKKGTPVMHYGLEATDETERLCLDKDVTILIDSISKSRDRYKRLLGYVLLSDGEILNEHLVENGFAYADLRFKHSYYKKYKMLAEKCQKKKIGLWKDLTEEQKPQWLIKYNINN